CRAGGVVCPPRPPSSGGEGRGEGAVTGPPVPWGYPSKPTRGGREAFAGFEGSFPAFVGMGIGRRGPRKRAPPGLVGESPRASGRPEKLAGARAGPGAPHASVRRGAVFRSERPYQGPAIPTKGSIPECDGLSRVLQVSRIPHGRRARRGRKGGG